MTDKYAFLWTSVSTLAMLRFDRFVDTPADPWRVRPSVLHGWASGSLAHPYHMAPTSYTSDYYDEADW